MHRTRAGAPGIHLASRATAAFSHQCRQTRHERGDLLGWGQGTGEQRPLDHAARSGLDLHDNAIDGGRGRMRLEVEQRKRTQRPRIAHRYGQLQRALVYVPGHQMQSHMQHGGTAIAPFEVRRQRLQKAPEDERQGLESLNRPVEIE